MDQVWSYVPSDERTPVKDPAPPPRLVDAISVALRVVSGSLQDVLEREEMVSLDQWRALRALSRHDGTTMSELADRLQIPAPSVTRLVDALVDRAFVYRHANSNDRRSVDVILSDTGWVLLGRLEELVRVHEEQYRNGTVLSIDSLIAGLRMISGSGPVSDTPSPNDYSPNAPAALP